MKIVGKIVFRERQEDQVLMIVPENELQGVGFELSKLADQFRLPLEDLRELCKSKISETLKYVLFSKEKNTLEIEDITASVLVLIISELPVNEKLLISNAGIACTQLLNESSVL